MIPFEDLARLSKMQQHLKEKHNPKNIADGFGTLRCKCCAFINVISSEEHEMRCFVCKECNTKNVFKVLKEV